MRKISASVLVLTTLLAIFGSAISAIAKSTDPYESATVQPYFILSTSKFIAVPASPHSIPGMHPDQFKKAYNLDKLMNQGAGITIAIVDACGNPNAQSDLDTYDKAFNLPAITIKIVQPEGKPCSDPNWGLETDLDLQMSHSIAPKAKIVLEEGLNNTNKELMLAVKDAYAKQGATVVSQSYGGHEWSGEHYAYGDWIYAAGVKLGVTFTASSGDRGCAFGGSYPATSPFNVAVGGTSLIIKPDGTYVSESAWSGSGGGLSKFEERPTYQDGINKNPKRSFPDVAMVSDPATGVSFYDSGTGGWGVVGGTSVAAPMWAGVLADANSGRSSTMKNADNQLYAIAKNSTKYAADFHDITQGSSGGICVAKKGYDLVTGWGTPIGGSLIADLIAQP